MKPKKAGGDLGWLGLEGISRRGFLKGLGALGWSLAAGTGGPLWGKEPVPLESRADLPGAKDPKVVLVQYGGCVRRRETIASLQSPHTTLSPFLFHRLMPEGTVLEAMRNDELTGHASGSFYLFSGAYPKTQDGPFQRPEPISIPMLGEYLVKTKGWSPSQSLVVHNEQLDTERIWASVHPDFGSEFAPGVLSIYRLRKLLLERDLEAQRSAGREREVVRAQEALEKHLAETQRREQEAYLRDSPELLAFWERYLDFYEPPGVRTREDLEPKGQMQSLVSLFDPILPQGDEGWTILAKRALFELRPRFLSVIYRDVDYVHWGLPFLYQRGIERMDRGLFEIARQIEQDPYYRGTTTLLVVPEAGRGTDPKLRLPFQHHGPEDPGSHEVFLYARGPGIEAGKRIDTPSQIIDVAPTVLKIFGETSPFCEGRVLDELWS